MSDTTVQDCVCCEIETDCIKDLCERCSDYNYMLQKQSDLLTLGLLQEKSKIEELEKKLKTLASDHMEKPITEHKDVQNLITKLEMYNQENKLLRRYIGELKERLAFEKKLIAVKVGGFNYHCTECKEKFDVPGRTMTCPYCKSIKIRVVQ